MRIGWGPSVPQSLTRDFFFLYGLDNYLLHAYAGVTP
jgi:hypothetical protein